MIKRSIPQPSEPGIRTVRRDRLHTLLFGGTTAVVATIVPQFEGTGPKLPIGLGD